MYTVYGIPNCNTVKKALDWLKENKVAYEFHDYKKKGITKEKLKAWNTQKGFELLVNKRGTTWRQLDEAAKAAVTTEKAAIELMLDKNSVIKRPVIENSDTVVVVGFDEKEYEKVFG